MNRRFKEVDDIAVADFELWPVWEFNLSNSELPDTFMFPVEAYPVDRLDNRIIGTPVILAGGGRVWARLEGVNLSDPDHTRKYLFVVFILAGRQIVLRQWVDDSDRWSSPQEVADFFQLPFAEVFPIKYDISKVCVGNRESIVGSIER